MNSQAYRWVFIIGAGIITGLILLMGIIWLFGNSGFYPTAGPMYRSFSPFPGQFDSNGERIYFTATSDSGQPIIPEIPGMHRMGPGMMACATCHGSDGRGGPVRMMMGTFEAPDIRYSTLTEAVHEHDNAHEEHPAYTDETIKRAITQGLDPAGEPLDWPMPRWRMSEQDLNDLLAYLKTLE